MEEMSEKEINDNLIRLKWFLQEEGDNNWQDYYNAIQGLLDLYNKEKEMRKELFEEYNKRVSTIIAYEQGLMEIVEAEDDPDTWAYYKVKAILKEVGGIDYE